MFGFNILATKRGRLTAFFLLYVTEGIPNGFATVAIARKMRQEGVSTEAIGFVIAAFTLPWAWKWAIGPVVDLFFSERLGRRRAWIVAMQFMMCVTLLAALPIDYTTDVTLFALIIIVHNVFAATQDVAIDALACGTLTDRERGLANGLMFAGAWVGQGIGGPGVQFLSSLGIPFHALFFFVVGCILSITFGVTLQLVEPRGQEASRTGASRVREAAAQVKGYLAQARRAIFGSRPAFVGLLVALLPTGALSLSLALQTNLTVELALDDRQTALLNAVTIVIAAAGCVVGGYLSDRLGRIRMLALYIIGTAIPTVYFAVLMQQHHWIMPVDPLMPGTCLRLETLADVVCVFPHVFPAYAPTPPVGLIEAFWTANILFSVFQGLLYGTRTALFMDVCTPAVAATQFTAYMALLNFVTSYSSIWQGMAIDRWGYPLTLMIDAVFGMACVLLLPLMRRAASAPAAPAIPSGALSF